MELLNFADEYEARRVCEIRGSGIGGILGDVLGGLIGNAILPGVGGIVGAGLGGEVGGTAGGLASGEPIGKAALGALPGAAIGAATAGLGELATGGIGPGIGNLFGGGGDVTGGAPATATGLGPTPDITSTPLAAPMATAAAPGGAPAAGGGGGTPIGGIGSATGATAAPASLGQAIGTAAPIDSGGAGFAGTVGGGADVPFGTAGTTGAADAGSFTPDGGTNFGGNLVSYLEKNPGVLLSAGGLLESILQRNAPIPGLPAVQNEAGVLSTAGNANINALATGQLPPGAAAALENAAEGSKANLTSTFDRLGMGGSTSLAEALQGVDTAKAASTFTDLAQLSNLGLNEINAANPLLTDIMRTQIQQDQLTQDAWQRFAAALAGGTGGTRATA